MSNDRHHNIGYQELFQPTIHFGHPKSISPRGTWFEFSPPICDHLYPVHHSPPCSFRTVQLPADSLINWNIGARRHLLKLESHAKCADVHDSGVCHGEKCNRPEHSQTKPIFSLAISSLDISTHKDLMQAKALRAFRSGISG